MAAVAVAMAMASMELVMLMAASVPMMTVVPNFPKL